MANTKNHVAKKISRHDVEEDLIKQIALNNPITLDDLDPELRKSVLTWGAPSGAAYDDSDLRKRVVQLESNMAVNTVHDNQTDKDIIFSLCFSKQYLQARLQFSVTRKLAEVGANIIIFLFSPIYIIY